MNINRLLNTDALGDRDKTIAEAVAYETVFVLVSGFRRALVQLQESYLSGDFPAESSGAVIKRVILALDATEHVLIKEEKSKTVS